MLAEADSVFTSILDDLDPEATPTPNAIEALTRVGVLRRLREQHREADPILRSAMEMGTRLLGPEHPYVLEASQEYGMNLYALGQWDEAERLLRRTRSVSERVLGPEHEITATIGEGLATVLEELGRYDEGLLYEQISLEEKVRRHEGRDHPGVASSLSGVGRFLVLSGRFDEARNYLGRADAMIERLGTTPSVYSISVERARGIMLSAEGDFAGADEHFRRAIRLCDELLTRRSHRFATGAKLEYATMLIAAGRREEAVALLEETEALIIERVGEPHPLVDRARALRAEARSG
jgi:tetratricopeptide (TPR) repeat protein